MPWQPSADLAQLRLRAALNRLIRDFFAQRGVLEVETPLLSAAGVTDAHIESWQASASTVRADACHWLRTSPEYALKRLLAAGCGDCYELGRVFRAGECGNRHNPEFTLLEWYRVGWNHHQLMDETVALVTAALESVGQSSNCIKLSYQALFLRYAGIDPADASIAALQAALLPHTVVAEGLDRDDWLNLVLTHCIEPQLPARQITVVYDFPATQAALARIRADDPHWAERFEVYYGGLELANGYHELCDANEQRARFARDLEMRRRSGLSQPPVDERLLAALQHGMPPCAGVALGTDRLLMAMTGADRIEQVLAFAHSRA